MDLWAKVFAYLKPNQAAAGRLFDVNDMNGEQTQYVSEVITAQAHYHKLKLVCSKFKQVFQEHSELSDELTLAEGSPTWSLMRWSDCGKAAAPFAASKHSVEVPLKIWQQWLLRHHNLSTCI